jgi:hypothetical protein
MKTILKTAAKADIKVGLLSQNSPGSSDKSHKIIVRIANAHPEFQLNISAVDKVNE